YPVLVHRLAASLHASFPHSVALMQLRFASFVVTNLRRDLHPQECAHAGRTRKRPPEGGLRLARDRFTSGSSCRPCTCKASSQRSSVRRWVRTGSWTSHP